MFGNVIIRERGERKRKGKGMALEQKKGGSTLFLPSYIFKGEKYQWKTGKKGERSGCGIHSSGGVCIATQREALPPLQSHERKGRRKTVRTKKKKKGSAI